MLPLTLDTLRARCNDWQHVLRLQDWDLRLEICRLSALEPGTLADCSAHEVKRQAKIRLLDPRDVDGQGFWFDGEAWDWEVSLVHELLHLHFHDVFPEGWPHKDKALDRAGERAIDAIAKALIARDRPAALVEPSVSRGPGTPVRGNVTAFQPTQTEESHAPQTRVE